ncbi:MAG TPA: glycosyltransferase family 2 protein [Thermoanaerobaculia bacterium]|nr:glycosyltransferase family 2 protein [Thermoanaerobaculia bacterium]
MPAARPAISAVVPVYNGEATLPELVARLGAALAAAFPSFEVLLVNDGSADGSWEAISLLAAADPRVRGIDLMRNYGQHNALLCGIRQAKGELIVTLDDDLQHPPEEIPVLRAALGPAVDVVYGTPREERHGLLRDLASQLTKWMLAGAMGGAIARQVGAFRLFRTQVREAFADYQSPYVSVDVLLTWGTTRFAAVPVRHDPRRAGRSNYTLRLLVRHALNMVTGFSVQPLQAASLVGFGATLFGLLVLAWVLGRYLLQGTSVPGFPFLASLIAIFSGAQLFTLGILGEYLARLHLRAMARPVYTVRGSTPR